MNAFYRELIDAALEALQRKADTAENPEDILDHKTLLGDDGFLYHVPLTRREPDQMRRCKVTAD